MGKFITLLLIIAPMVLLSQNKIKRKGGLFKIDTLGAKYQPIGIFGKNLRPIIEQNPSAYPLFKKAVRNEKITFFASGLTLVGLTSFVVGFSSELNDSSRSASKEKRDTFLIAFGGISMITGLIVSPVAGITSYRQYKKAIKIYNNLDLGVNGNREVPATLHLQCSNDGLGVLLTF